MDYAPLPLPTNLMMLLFWVPALLQLAVIVWSVVTLQRLLVGQRAIRAQLEQIERRVGPRTG